MFAHTLQRPISNVHQRTVNYPDELANGFHIMLDIGKLVTVRWKQVETEATPPGMA